MNEPNMFVVNVNLFISATSEEEAFDFAQDMMWGKETMTNQYRIFGVRRL